jgi:hypothetical protein
MLLGHELEPNGECTWCGAFLETIIDDIMMCPYSQQKGTAMKKKGPSLYRRFKVALDDWLWDKCNAESKGLSKRSFAACWKGSASIH